MSNVCLHASLNKVDVKQLFEQCSNVYDHVKSSECPPVLIVKFVFIFPETIPIGELNLDCAV